MSWASRRKWLYGGVAAIIVALFFVWLWYAFFSAPPTCFDNVQNGGEVGVDCGGPCARLCTEQEHAPQVEWARALRVATSTYTAVAYIDNPNRGAGAYQVSYAFRLFDSNNLLLLERDGVMDIPAEQTTPLVENNLVLGDRTVARTFLEFSGNILWQKIPQNDQPSLRVTNIVLAPDGSRVSATVVNDGNNDARNVTVDAVLFDSSDTAQAASKSAVDLIPAGGSQAVVFTWPTPHQNIVRTEITPVPSLPPQR